MRWLIVTADELGLSSKRNQGIVDAHCKGIVTSVSMLAYGPAFREAVKIAKALPKLDIGLHLNLSQGEPLVLGHKTLVGPDGLFWGRQEARQRARDQAFDLREVEREADAQFETLRTLPVGLTELMVHPGIAATADGFEGPEREAEVRALTDARLKPLLKELGIGLTHFGKL